MTIAPRLDWPSAIGNILLNFSTLDLVLLDRLESLLPSKEFNDAKESSFYCRLTLLRDQFLKDPSRSSESFEPLFKRIESMRDLRNHLAHGVMRLEQADGYNAPELTLSFPKELGGSSSPTARRVRFEELEQAVEELPKLIEALRDLP